MMVLVNHFIAAVLSPLGIWFFAMIATVVLAKLGRRRCAWTLGIAASVFLWAFSCSWTGRLLILPLEKMYPPVEMADVPKADAIVILGGGMGSHPETHPLAEMYAGADRVWQAARLWKAGKAPVVMASGTNEVFSTKPLLLDLGVPESAIRIENAALNTEQNAKFVQEMVSGGRILLVTSSWHMRRAKLMFERYAPKLEVVAAPCDYEATLYADEPLGVAGLFPGAENLVRNAVAVKEIIGYYGYKWLR